MGTRENEDNGPGLGKKRAMPDAFIEVLLRNPNRRGLLELLKQRPGLNKNQLADALRLHPNTLDFHLDRLADAGLVVTRPGWRVREILCFLTEDAHLWEDESTRMLYGQGPMRDLAVYLAKNPPAEVKEVAAALGMSLTSVRNHLRLLEARELVQRLRVDRQVLYHAEPALEAWVEEVGAGPGRDPTG